MVTAVVDDHVAINLDGRAIVGPRGESVLAIAIDPKPTVPFDAELLLRQRRRIRGHEVEIDLSLDAHNSRLVSPVRVRVERRRNPPLWPNPQDWHEEDRHEENTCHAPHVRAQAWPQVRGKPNRRCMRLACFMSRSSCTLAVDKSFELPRERRNEVLKREPGGNRTHNPQIKSRL